jgi:hypothetical protein
LAVLCETIGGIYMKKMDDVLIKMDFEKSYGRVKSSFLQQTLMNEMIPPLWCEWVTRFVQGGSIGIQVSHVIIHYFQTLKGLQQCDMLYPLPFNVVADMLAILIARAKYDGQVGGFIPHLLEGRFSLAIH